MIAHIVLFEPKSGTSSAQRRDFLDSITRAAREIPDVLLAKIGTTLSIGIIPEKYIGAKTYSYAAVFEFADQDGLQRYLRHPVHHDLRRRFWDLCLATLIVDVEMTDADAFQIDQ